MLEGQEAEEEQKARTELLKTTDTMISGIAVLLGLEPCHLLCLFSSVEKAHMTG